MSTHMLEEIKQQPGVIARTIQQNTATLRELTGSLKKHPVHSIMVTARGTSYNVGIFAKYFGEYFLGLPVSTAAASIINLYHRPMKLDSVLTLAISQSGEGPDILGVIKEAKAEGSLTVGITNHERSTLAREVDFPIITGAGIEQSIVATKTCTASMMAVASLIQTWSGDRDFGAKLEKVPDLLAKLIVRDAEIAEKAYLFKVFEDCVIMARGLNYCAALETAFKIQETCYLNARGYSAADILHGPIAMLDDNFSALVFACQGPSLPGEVGTISRLKQIGTPLLLITNDTALLNENRMNFQIQDEFSEEIMPFASVVFGQIFAYYLAQLKGRNPDFPRRLKKVTQTL